jgi:hypothetical protein
LSRPYLPPASGNRKSGARSPAFNARCARPELVDLVSEIDRVVELAAHVLLPKILSVTRLEEPAHPIIGVAVGSAPSIDAQRHYIPVREAAIEPRQAEVFPVVAFLHF